MEPKGPVVQGLEPFEIIFGENQPCVTPLTALRKADGTVISRWVPTEQERVLISEFGHDIYLFQSTYFQPPMPIDLQVLHAAGLDASANRDALGLTPELNHRLREGKYNRSIPMLLLDRSLRAAEPPKKFPSHEAYYNALEQLHDEWKGRTPDQAEMDFEEWKVSEIVRLRALLAESVKTV